MSAIEKDIKQYIKDINKNLLCDRKNRQQIISDIENSIYDFAENKGISDIKEIYDRFGTPDEVAKQYLSQEYKKTVNNTADKRTITVTAIVCSILLIIISALLFYFNVLWDDNLRKFNRYIVYVDGSSEYMSEYNEGKSTV